MLPDLVGRSKVERIAVLVSYGGTSKFLGAPKLTSSSGENIAVAVHKLLTDWNLCDKVKAAGFDTTSSNTGVITGALVQMKELFGLEYLPLPCHHHIYEIVLRGVFETKMGKSSAPEVPAFERFMAEWKNLDKTQFKNGLEDPIVRSKISNDVCTDIKDFCHHQLSKIHCRSEYREFLELVLIFLGVDVDDRLKFRAPGPTSHARFMGKGIYDLKMFLFRDQFKLSAVQLKGIREMCIFIVRLYIKAWFCCMNPIAAPNLDFNFILDSILYAETDKVASEKILEKMSNHMWYLSEETIGLAFFDPNVSAEVKRKMVERLNSETPIVKLANGRKLQTPQDLPQYDLSAFVSKKTKIFFNRFGISDEFLNCDPLIWETNDEFQKGLLICQELPVVNDSAERGVKFFKDFNRVLTIDEEEKQLLYQIVESYRRKYPSYNKSCLMSEA